MDKKSDSQKITGLVIAAGFSSRMQDFKPLMEFNGNSFLAVISEKLLRVCEDIIVVTGFNEPEIVAEIEKFLSKKEISPGRIQIIENENYERGMFSSLQCGLNKTDADWVVYHFVDQPSLPENFYADFINQIDETHNWIQPVRANRKGHPILLRNDLFKSIVESSKEMDLRTLSENAFVKKKFWECSYPEIFDDIDTPVDYARLTERS